MFSLCENFESLIFIKAARFTLKYQNGKQTAQRTEILKFSFDYIEINFPYFEVKKPLSYTLRKTMISHQRM